MRYLIALVIILSIFSRVARQLPFIQNNLENFQQNQLLKNLKNYYWGLVGEHRFNVKGICGVKKVVQIQSQQTFKKYIFKSRK